MLDGLTEDQKSAAMAYDAELPADEAGDKKPAAASHATGSKSLAWAMLTRPAQPWKRCYQCRGYTALASLAHSISSPLDRHNVIFLVARQPAGTPCVGYLGRRILQRVVRFLHALAAGDVAL